MKLSKWILLLIALGIIPMALMAHQDSTQPKTEMVSHVPLRPLAFEEVERFHGHVGPNVALGARMGEHAVTVGKIPKYFGLTVRVECPAEPPGSCLIDGLQVSSGATMGKKNIIHVPAEAVKVTISDNKSGKQITYTVSPATQSLINKWKEEKVDIEEQGKRLFSMKPEDLFVIETKS